MSRHSIIDDHIVFLSIAIEVRTVCSIQIGRLVFDQHWQQMIFYCFLTEKVENCSQVTELDV